MIRVMIVEDEPVAMRYIASLIEKRCSYIKIVAKAENGQEAIDLLTNLHVDIVITDVQMAYINGIQLALWLHNQRPDTLTLIVSGYSDFEYAKGAIRAGVVEYLLKPINPSEFVSAMEKLYLRAMQLRRSACERWLRLAEVGVPASHAVLGFKQNKNIILGAMITGAAPNNRVFAYPPDAPLQLTAIRVQHKDEIFFAFPLSDCDIPQELIVMLAGDAPYYTALVKTITSEEDCSDLPQMLHYAKNIAVPGIAHIGQYTDTTLDEQVLPEEKNLIRKLRYAITNSQFDKIKEGLVALFALWEHESRRLVYAETTLVRLLLLMIDNVPSGHGWTQQDILQTVPILCRKAWSFPDMLRRTWEICLPIYRTLERQGEGGDIIDKIELYIQEHLGKPLSVQNLCTVFGVSSSYLNQLFRKYLKMSFVEYITDLRVKEAKRMMIQSPSIPIKDIAGFLGFSDQFYFSKVFRSITGMSPSEFKTSVKFSI